MMILRNYRLIALFVFIALMAGCSTPQIRQETNTSFIDRQITLARHHQKNNELATALNHWKIIGLLDPSHAEAKSQQKTLKKTLRDRATVAYAAGLRAFKSGNRKNARMHFLSTLAAQPGHRDAHQKLRVMQKNRMTKAQNKKSLMEQKNLMVDQPANGKSASDDLEELKTLFNKGQYQKLLSQVDALSYPDPPVEIKRLVADSHFKLVGQLISDNMPDKASSHLTSARRILPTDLRIATLSKNLATAYHKAGRLLLSTDINQGIKQLEKSLEYDSSNSNVRGLLKQNQLMQKKLSKIAGGK